MSDPVVPSKASVPGMAEMQKQMNYRSSNSCSTCKHFVYTEYRGMCGWVLKKTNGKMRMLVRTTYICDMFQVNAPLDARPEKGDERCGDG